MRGFGVGIFRIAAAMAAAFASCAAQATLVLDTSLQGGHGFQATGANLQGNDLGNKPNRVHFGQLSATANGQVDFYGVGSEASFSNSLHVNGNSYSSSNGFGLPQFVGTVDSAAGAFLSFGFCTSGGNAMGGFGGCAHNDNTASLLAQFGQGANKGYRSIGFAALSSFDETTGEYTFGDGTSSDLWMIFWDDSGAHNDDDHDDYVAIARFRGSVVDLLDPLSDLPGGPGDDTPGDETPNLVAATQVPEPATGLLLTAGLAALGFVSRRRSAARA